MHAISELPHIVLDLSSAISTPHVIVGRESKTLENDALWAGRTKPRIVATCTKPKRVHTGKPSALACSDAEFAWQTIPDLTRDQPIRSRPFHAIEFTPHHPRRPMSAKTSKTTKPSKPAKLEKSGKASLVAAIGAELGGQYSQKIVGEMFDAFTSCLLSAAKTGGASVPGLGTFSVKSTAARVGVKPGTSEKINIPAGKKLAFKASSTLKGTL
jgi:DNA-binding protein HU-beta